MYRLDWIEQVKLKTKTRSSSSQIRSVSPVVWKLGLTSFLTDISSEMINSVLPIYLVLHLHLSPLQYGAVDGVYNGLAVILISLASGAFADRSRRHKEVALTGYGLSAVCKLLLFVAGGVWGWLMVVVGLDRIGKGMRSAPRDALISLNTPPHQMASAFSVHRSLDAGGALLGPVVAFMLLARLPGAFDVLWATSFVFAILGVAALAIYVPKPNAGLFQPDSKITKSSARSLFGSRRFATLIGCGLLLSVATVNDGFLYLILQERGETSSGLIPLFYVLTAASYMAFSIPAGVCADRFGRGTVFIGGYVVLGILYALLLTHTNVSGPMQIGCLLMLGLYYAGTEGVLAAMASQAISAEMRTTGYAILATAIALGKMGSSILFGWIWSSYGVWPALASFGTALLSALFLAAVALRAFGRNESHDKV
jgi:MFS family permease